MYSFNMTTAASGLNVSVSLAYFKSLLGPYGLYQHASYTTPRLEEGYCTDDNARAVQLLIELQHSGFSQETGLSEALNLCWDFLVEAQTTGGLFRNFRSANGVWLDNSGSEETQSRALRALSSVITLDHNKERSQQAEGMLDRLLPHIKSLRYLRSQAETLVALLPLMADRPHVQRTVGQLWKVYYQRWERVRGDWPWPEVTMTYSNALLVHGLLAGSQAVGLPLPNRGAESMRFLLRATIEEALFLPIGNSRWFRADSLKSLYDQQPIEAHAMFDCALLYYQMGGNITPAEVVAPYLWFFGHNSLRASLVNQVTGSCYDGLTATGPNLNCGAESTLAYLRSEWLMQHAPSTITQYAVHQLQQQGHQKVDATHPT